MLAPETVHLSPTPRWPDALVEPNVVFGPGVAVEGGASQSVPSRIRRAHRVGRCRDRPYCAAEARPDVGAKAKVGNFCEDQDPVLDEGAKVNLS